MHLAPIPIITILVMRVADNILRFYRIQEYMVIMMFNPKIL